MSLDKIIDDKLPSWKRWRKDFAEQHRKAELLEQFAAEKQLPDGFELISGTLLWHEYGHEHGKEEGKTSLYRFRTMILATANRLGRPEKVTETNSYGEVPDLQAQWTAKLSDGSDVLILVKIYSPKGCKLDPRVVARKVDFGTPAKLHPECQAVLKELEELEAPASP